jgi:hypothetical protein
VLHVPTAQKAVFQRRRPLRPGAELDERQPASVAGLAAGVDFFIQIAINELSEFVAEHFQVGFGIRWTVMLQSIYVHGVKRLEAINQYSL